MERSCEPMDKNRIEGVAGHDCMDAGGRAKQEARAEGEWAVNHEALVIKARWRKSGGCAVKECVLTWGDLALCLKGRR